MMIHKFPTDGDTTFVGESVTCILQLSWCESRTDSTVWMREDKLNFYLRVYV